MNDDIILSLEAVRRGDTQFVGQKAANLGELIAAGFPVPPAFVVTTAAFRRFFGSLELQDEIDRIDQATDKELRDRCRRIQQHILSGTIAKDIADEILAAYRTLSETDEHARSAVRSSATAEDLARASFAGQHRTYYHVESAYLLEIIRHCWASLWSPEAALYRAARGISDGSVAMAVIVQRMVRSEVSGIAFSADPITLDPRTIIIESTWGLGAAIMDGRVIPDRYVVDRLTLQVRERRVTEKCLMVPADPISSEPLVEVQRDMRNVETLSQLQIEAVAALAVRCEQHFGSPQDVEWALADGELHLLQSRAVTTLRRKEIAAPKGKWVLFKPVVENFSDPLTPLQIDLMTRVFSGFLRPIGDRFYVNIAPLRWLLPVDLSDEAVASLVYLTGDDMPMRVRPRLLKLPMTILAGAVVWLATGVLLARSRGMPGDFMDGYRTLCRAVDSDSRFGPLDALRRLLTAGRFGDPIGQMVVTVNFGAAIRSSFWVGVVKAMLRRWAPEHGADAVATLCAGSEGVLSVEMGHDLAALADFARREPGVVELLAKTPAEEMLSRLQATPAAREFLRHLEAFLAKHGHRTAKEFEVQTPRWEENPSAVLAAVKNFLIEAHTGPRAMPKRVEQSRETLETHLRQSLGLRWIALRFAAQRAREFLKLRENSRFYHIMGIGVVRRKLLLVEEELLRDNKLKRRGDIFYLLWSEVTALRSGSLRWQDVEERLHNRRIEHVRLSKFPPPRTFGIETTSSASMVVSGDVLHGQCASPGRYEGVARVILDPCADTGLRPGEVLVAPYADPAWSPLFLTAGAAVVEVGSYLSHAGTVAREYGMPLLVEVRECTRRLRSGMRVLVDGNHGTVRILEEESA
ncbi:MAG TPA: PEP/pyruvate-binding domain-containing protein [Thermoanaerobaculia bacterium]|nr:PEP/pyruvate-binding domain-containing protein [Thermoanaerobaculia bacterium]